MHTPTRSLQAAVRHELGLGGRRPRRRRSLLGLAATAALLCGLGAARSDAQPPWRQDLLKSFSSYDVGDRSSPAFVDLDGDGDLDAVVGAASGTVHTFTNTGTSTAPAFLEAQGTANPFDGIDVGINASPALADLDGDGDLDAVVGESQQALHYFANTGTSTAPAFVERTGTANPFSGLAVSTYGSPALADLDGDGDLDAVVGNDDGCLRTFANTGSSTAPAFAELTGTANPFAAVDVGYSSQPELADLDGDGDLDAVVGESLGTLHYLANTGSSTAPAFAELTGTANPFAGIDVGLSSSPALVDLDGDDDLDLWLGEEPGGIWAFANTGWSMAPAFAELTGTANPFGAVDLGEQSAGALADLDGDGDLDAVAGALLGRLDFFTNTGRPWAPALVAQTGTANPFDGVDIGARSTPMLVDLDGDGDLDAVVGATDGSLHYFANTGSSAAPAFFETGGTANPNPLGGFDAGDHASPDLADLDGDGDLDAVVGAFSGTLHYYLNTGSSTAPAFSEQTGSANPFDGFDVGFRSAPDLVDFDGDGDFDAVVGASLGGLHYFLNTGTSTAPAFAELTGSANPFVGVDAGVYDHPMLADLDADGDLDVLLGESGGRLVFFRSLAADLFSDGFESGDTSRWALTFPP